MKLENVPTPICNAEGGDGWSGSAECISLDTGLTLERKLGLAVAALKELSCLGNGDQPGNSTGNRIAQETLAQIEEKKK